MSTRPSTALHQPGLIGQICLDSYTSITVGFCVPDHDRNTICSKLDQASIRLSVSFPFLAGQVIIEGRNETNSGTYKTIPYPPHDGKSLVYRKDCDSVLPSYADILAAKAPFSLLDGEIISPKSGYGTKPETPWPVLILQANFVSGGLLLTFAALHNALDMNGLGQVIKLFAQACCSELFDPEDVRLGNEDPALEGLRVDEQAVDTSAIRRPSQLAQWATPAPPSTTSPSATTSSASWRYWRLKAARLAQLKKASEAYSTNDAVTALLAQRLIAVRVARGILESSEPIHVGRATNLRRALGLTDRHLIHAVATVYTLVQPEQNLSSAAKALRRDLAAYDGRHVRSFVSLMQNEKDKSTVQFGVGHRPGKDLVVSSWARLEVSTLVFGGLGCPDFVRRPQLGPYPDLAYVMPRTVQGDMDVALCVDDEDSKALEGDEVWREWVEYIG